MAALKRMLACVAIVVFSCVGYVQNVSAYPINSRTITPGSPDSDDFITAQVNGIFSAAGYSFDAAPIVTRTANNIFIDMFVTTPSGWFNAMVMTPFSVNANLGTLSSGTYYDTYRLFFHDSGRANYYLKDTYSSSFSVTKAAPVPEPASLLLMSIGIGLFFFWRRKALAR